jgi:membrane protease YdiL (CAAX protease family)
VSVPPPPPPPPPGAGGPPAGPPERDVPWPAGGVPDGPRPDTAFRVPFSAIEGFLLVLWTLVAQFVVFLPAVFLGLLDPTEGGPALLVLLIAAQGLALGGALAYLSARGRLSWRLLGPRRPAWRHAAIGLGVGIAGFVGVNVLIQLAIRIVGPVEPPEQQLLSDVTEGGLTMWLAIAAAVVMAPLVEEVVFRGVFFQGLKRRIGLWPGALVSGALFAAIHVEVQQPLYTSGLLFLGVLFGWVMHRFGSLVVPLVAHATFNAVSVGLTVLGARVLDAT